MTRSGFTGRLIERLEAGVIVVLQLALVVIILSALFELCALIVHALIGRFGGLAGFTVASLPDLQRAVQRGFAGVLLIMLGLELLDSARVYAAEHRLRLEVVIIVATIAVARHVILLDLEHVDALMLLGVGAVLLALTAGYFLIRRAAASQPPARSSTE